MAVRVQFEGNNEIGVFSKLTNKYCLVAIGGSANFYRYVKNYISHSLRYHVIYFYFIISVFEGELSDAIPVVYASIGDCRIVGRLCVGECGTGMHRSAVHCMCGSHAMQVTDMVS